jgi:hypothetical protein
MDVAKMSPEQLRAAGMRALARDLGPAGLVRFLQQFETGSGDYSVERDQLLPQVGVRELVSQIRTSRSASDE